MKSPQKFEKVRLSRVQRIAKQRMERRNSKIFTISKESVEKLNKGAEVIYRELSKAF